MDEGEVDKNKILYVEDNKLLLTYTKINLENSDYDFEVDTAQTVAEALKFIKKTDYDAVISDYLLEEQDGLDLLRTLREEKGSDIPFIMFTGKGDETVAQKALNMGADRYIRKKGDAKSQYDRLAEALIELIRDEKG
ncbi:MAG: response regulator [Candidatus Thermoplasmatota archaeon]|nr:response regulator [Candidatus Thermoplasmatota archaeon]MBS3817788.1 response regulator [Candidatus Thermoplasmatota archaeon]